MQDTLLNNRTPLSVPNIITLLEFCLKSIFFMFQGKLLQTVTRGCYENFLFMEDLEARALSTSPNPPRIWLRYVDDTFVFIRWNTPNISLPTLIPSIPIFSLQLRPLFNKDPPFLDTLLDSNGSLITTDSRKHTHIGQYLHWDSHHSTTNRQCQDTNIQGPSCLFKPTVTGTRISAHQNCPQQMQVQ